MKNNPFAFFIALRYTYGASDGRFTSLITRMSVLGMTLGVALLILVLSVMNGFDRELREKILAIIPHILIYKDQPIDDWPTLQAQVQSVNSVVLATPYAEQNGLLSKGRSIEPVQLYGLDFASEENNPLLSKVLGKTLLNQLQTQPNNIALGRLIAKRMGVVVGDKVTFIVPNNTLGHPASIKSLTVSTLLSTGTELDNQMALTSLRNLAQIRTTDHSMDDNPNAMVSADGIRIVVEDMFLSHSIALDILRELPLEYRGLTWAQTQGTLYQAIQTSRNMVLLLVFLVLAIAAFNVLSSLMIMSAEKKADIAILKTLGASRKQLFAIFSTQGLVIGFWGSSLGAFLGIVSALWITPVVAWFEALSGVQFLQADIYPIDYLPSDLQLQQVAIVCISAVILSTIAALYPAWLAV